MVGLFPDSLSSYIIYPLWVLRNSPQTQCSSDKAVLFNRILRITLPRWGHGELLRWGHGVGMNLFYLEIT